MRVFSYLAEYLIPYRSALRHCTVCTYSAVAPFSRWRFRDTPHSTNETGATNCYIQKTKAAALKTPTRNGFNAQGVNFTLQAVIVAPLQRYHSAYCRCLQTL